MISHRTHRLRRTLSLAFCVLAVIAALVVVTVGRGTNPANLLPRVTASSSDSKVLYVDFSSVVNLPLGARVLSRGTQIGTLNPLRWYRMRRVCVCRSLLRRGWGRAPRPNSDSRRCSATSTSR